MGRTVAIIDFAHCGTTMIAGVLEMLGVPMVGEHYDERTWEDLEIVGALQAGEDAFASVVERRNLAHEQWGFKWPGRREYWPLFRECLREPVFLAIYKDPVSVTRRRFGRSNDRWLRKLRQTARQMQSAIDKAYELQMPMTTFSYHYAITLPGVFIRAVGATVGIEPTYKEVARIGQYIQPNVEGPRRPYPLVQEYL